MELNKKLPINISARHVHLSQKDLEELFGQDYELKILRELSQPNEFAAQETITLKTGLKKIENVRIVGPVRDNTQIEISPTEARFLGINPPIRISGDIKNSPGISLIGPQKEIIIDKGVIIPWRHIHCNPKEAEELGLKDKMLVSVKVNTKHPVTFHNIIVLVKNDCNLELHLNTEEGNSACMTEKEEGTILRIDDI